MRRCGKHMSDLKAGAPLGEKRTFASRLCEDFGEPYFALRFDFAEPCGEQAAQRSGSVAANIGAEHVQIVNFAEEILEALQVGSPKLISARQKILGDITEML